MRIYIVTNWQEIYENSQSKRVGDLRWVPIPNRHDGETFSELMAHPNGVEIYGAWVLILQVASKCPTRGRLVKDNGVPHSARSLSVKTRAPERVFDLAFDYLTQNTDWLDFEELTETVPSTLGARSEQTPSTLGADSEQTPSTLGAHSEHALTSSCKKERKKEGMERKENSTARNCPESENEGPGGCPTSSGDALGETGTLFSLEAQPEAPRHLITPADIYDAYPKKVDRADALAAVGDAIRRGTVTPEVLLDRVTAYAAAVAGWKTEDRQFVPSLARFVKKGKFNDDPETWIRHETNRRDSQVNRNAGTLNNNPGAYAEFAYYGEAPGSEGGANAQL